MITFGLRNHFNHLVNHNSVFSFQAGEFFSSAQSSAAAHQREFEGQHNGEGSIDSPLLIEQVCFCSHYVSFSSFN